MSSWIFWHFWHGVTRLGEVPVALPLALLMGWSLKMQGSGPVRLKWMSLLGAAVLLTTATKLAFIGWGIGSAALNFTGISGHAMFAAAVYPPLLAALPNSASHGVYRAWVAAGCVVALLVGVSRFLLGAHSPSEIVAGWAVGGAVAFGMLVRRPAVPLQFRPLVLLAIALWLALFPAAGPAVDTHSIVTRLALALSGHEQPFTRSMLLRGR